MDIAADNFFIIIELTKFPALGKTGVSEQNVQASQMEIVPNEII